MSDFERGKERKQERNLFAEREQHRKGYIFNRLEQWIATVPRIPRWRSGSPTQAAVITKMSIHMIVVLPRVINSGGICTLLLGPSSRSRDRLGSINLSRGESIAVEPRRLCVYQTHDSGRQKQSSCTNGLENPLIALMRPRTTHVAAML